MGSRESIPCPHCGEPLAYTSGDKTDGGLAFHWPPESAAHLATHKEKAEK